MKKQISTLLASILLVVSLLVAVPAFAADSDFPEPNWGNIQDISVYVNGEYDPNYVETVYDQESDAHTFTYIGSGKLTGWEFPWSVEGTDYELISESGNSVTLRFINEYHGIPYVNVLVDFGTDSAPSGESGSSSGTADDAQTAAQGDSTASSGESTQNTAETETTSAPETGAASNIVPVAAVTVLCVAVVAVIVVVAVRRKKNG